MTGNVIVLNGTSSAGKTTLARQIQSISPDVYLLCSLDAFWDMTPIGIPAGSKHFPNMKLAIAKSVRALAETGHNVIVDIVFCGEKTYLEMVKELNLLNLSIIKVECSLVELEKRELARGDRKRGLAKSQLNTVHKDVVYDLELDTQLFSKEQCAEMVLNKVVGG